MQFKLIGTLIHGIGYYLYLVSPFVPDNADLSIHCIHDALVRAQQHRAEMGHSSYCPPAVRIQLGEWAGRS